MIIHVEERDLPYAQIERACLGDARLSWAARGLLAYLLSKPQNWEVRREELVHASTHDGRYVVQKLLTELAHFGYAKLETVQDGKGRIQGKRYVIAERPKFNVPSQDHRRTNISIDGENASMVERNTRQFVAPNKGDSKNKGLSVPKTPPTMDITDDGYTAQRCPEDLRSKKDPESNTQGKRKREDPPVLLRKPSPLGETGYSAGFESFWQIYPVKKGKGKAWMSWQRQHLDPLQAIICRSVEDHLERDEDWHRNYIKHPATFLNARCWEDDLATVRTPFSGMTDKEYRTFKNSQELMEILDHDPRRPEPFLSLAERHGNHV